ncbi:hemin-degrading factor [Thioalkalivibrio sp. ALJT]|uniref:hemin-degrading factor n=1 Tax=Thioalkalivibrio sp. ALJT TaxID=1158146 RepID=UPI0003814074|nr:hemin-degrading factor [Thioalkalivibrio sp. ALJT]
MNAMTLLSPLQEPTPESTREIVQRWQSLKDAEPQIRARDAADRLGVSEAQLVAARCDGLTIVRLRPAWADLLAELESLGSVMALTRNEHVVHEKHGKYLGAKVFGNMGLLVNPDIDLRLFLSQWDHVFAVTEETRSGVRHSLQVFCDDGLALHKIYATQQTDDAAWSRLVGRFRAADQSPGIRVSAPHAIPADPPDSFVDVGAMRARWDALKDTHDFVDLLRQFGVGRLQSLRLAGSERAYPVQQDAGRIVLEYARDDALPIMVFVGNRGLVQIHTGPVSKLVPAGDWFNVLDPQFNLHVRVSAIHSAWVVAKPTVDGPVHSLELFDEQGTLLMQVFGERKPGRPQDPRWRALLGVLEPCNSAEASHHVAS